MNYQKIAHVKNEQMKFETFKVDRILQTNKKSIKN